MESNLPESQRPLDYAMTLNNYATGFEGGGSEVRSPLEPYTCRLELPLASEPRPSAMTKRSNGTVQRKHFMKITRKGNTL